MKEENIKEKLLKLENKLGYKIHLGYKDAVNTSTNKIMIFIGIITIILTGLGRFLGSYINNKYEAIKEITRNYEDAKVLENMINLQDSLKKIRVLTGNVQPRGNVYPEYIGQIYIQSIEDTFYGPVTYIATSISNKDRRIISLIDPFNGGNSLIPQIEGYYEK